jgi:lysophospholipid acyltransferase (LPLAT)-like uncharacterized protein
MCIPKPFARLDIVYGAPIEVGPGKDGMRGAMEAVGRALQDVTHAA